MMTYHYTRGYSWDSSANNMCVAIRDWGAPWDRFHDLGFRIVRSYE